MSGPHQSLLLLLFLLSLPVLNPDIPPPPPPALLQTLTTAKLAYSQPL
jgi:hypothetical protein